MKNVFAYITCPRVLKRFKEEMEMTGLKDIPELPKKETVPDKSPLLFICDKQKKVILEEFTFDFTEDENAAKFAEWIYNNVIQDEKLKTDIVVLSDEDFRDFVTHSTEVITRTKINNETGTVQDGQLFTEEYLPQESILYSLVMASPIFNEEKGIFQKDSKEKQAQEVLTFFQTGLSSVFQLEEMQQPAKVYSEPNFWELKMISEDDKKKGLKGIEQGRADYAYRCVEDAKGI